MYAGFLRGLPASAILRFFALRSVTLSVNGCFLIAQCFRTLCFKQRPEMESVWQGFTARIATHYSASPGQRAQRVVMPKPVTATSPPRITKGFFAGGHLDLPRPQRPHGFRKRCRQMRCMVRELHHCISWATQRSIPLSVPPLRIHWPPSAYAGQWTPTSLGDGVEKLTEAAGIIGGWLRRRPLAISECLPHTLQLLATSVKH